MRSLALCIATLVCTTAQAAEMTIEDSSMHERKQSISAMAILGTFGTYSHFGLGAWYAIPVLPDGFIPTLNDSLAIEFGAAIERYGWEYNYLVVNCSASWYRLSPMGGVRWNFHLTSDLTAYARVLAGYGIGFGDTLDCGGFTANSSPTISTFQVVGGAGASWQFDPNWALRFEIGNWPGVGVSSEL